MSSSKEMLQFTELQLHHFFSKAVSVRRIYASSLSVHLKLPDLCYSTNHSIHQDLSSSPKVVRIRNLANTCICNLFLPMLPRMVCNSPCNHWVLVEKPPFVIGGFLWDRAVTCLDPYTCPVEQFKPHQELLVPSQYSTWMHHSWCPYHYLSSLDRKQSVEFEYSPDVDTICVILFRNSVDVTSILDVSKGSKLGVDLIVNCCNAYFMSTLLLVF
jgi:hypothetical protein